MKKLFNIIVISLIFLNIFSLNKATKTSTEMIKKDAISPNESVQNPNPNDDMNKDLIFAGSNSASEADANDGNALGAASSDARGSNREYGNGAHNRDSIVVGLAESNTNARSQQGNAAAMTNSYAESEDKHFDLNGHEIPIYLPKGEIVLPNWANTKLKAIDVGVSSEGDIYAVGSNGLLYHFEFTFNRWTQVNADYTLKGIVRVAVNYDGTPYVITLTGEIYFLSCFNTWVRIQGCATDISAGRGGEVFKTGCKEDGRNVYRLFCECKCDCKFRNCKRYRKKTHLQMGGKPKCAWFKIEGNGVKISVSPSGWPYVINKTGNVLSYNGLRWRQIGYILAIDISHSNDGMLYVVGDDNNIYRVIDEANGIFRYVKNDNLPVVNISVGPLSLPFITTTDKGLFTSAKREFN